MAAAAVRMATRATPGALACQKDSFLQSLKTRVLACAPVTVAGGKKQPPQTFYELELLDTVLFPEGGGQPWDTGVVSGVPVERVYVKDGRCIHRIPPTADGSAPFQEGQEVVASVDWDRRFDHMQQHSAQHLFSAIAEKHGYETTTWSLGEERCNVELVPMDGSNTERKLIPMDKLLAIEREVNAAILKGTPMLPQYATPGSPEYEKIAAKFDGKDEKPDVMRIMSIEGIDWNPCCGTHVQNLTQLQSLRLLNVESARGATRVWFVAGQRVNREFSRMFQREQALTKLVSCGPEEHASRVEKLLDFQKSALKDIKNLQKELAASIAKDLLAQCKLDSDSPTSVVQYHRPDGDLAFLQALLANLGDAKDSVVFVLASGDVRGEGLFLLAGPPAFVTQHGKQVVQVIDGKGGGGKNGVFQGKAKALGKLDELVAKLTELRLE